MTTTASVSISRPSGGPLVIGSAGEADTWALDREGLGDPDMNQRLGYAPDSSAIHGKELLSASLDQTSIPLKVHVYGTDSADLRANRDALTAALSQFSYTTTVTVDGVSQIWSCDPASWSPGLVKVEQVSSFRQLLSITIPVFPVPA
jgi:hypothetical protein